MPNNTLRSGRESSLHSAIKEWYFRRGDKLEAKVDGYIIDIRRGDLLIEIQTANFSAIKTKLQHLLDKHKVRLVYPIPRQKWIIHKSTFSEDTFGRRRSPRKGCLLDLFNELIRIPDLFLNDNLSIEVLLIEEEEIWRNDGKGTWRRKGASIQDRRLIRIFERALFEHKTDFLKVLPKDLPQSFSNRNLAENLGIHINQSRRITYTLRKIGVITQVGKNGNQMLFARSESAKKQSTTLEKSVEASQSSKLKACTVLNTGLMPLRGRHHEESQTETSL